MVNDAWYDRFLDALLAKHPKKVLLVEALVDLLHIEQEAVYRRLRKEVLFSIHELATIASAWNISLDAILNVRSRIIPFRLQPVNYINPSEQELMFLNHIIQSIKSLKNFPDTEFMNICNKLPRQLLAGFDHLNRFYLFKWKYQYDSEKKPVPFSQIIISEEMRRLTADYCRAIKTVTLTNFILDRMIFDHLTDEIGYFHSIQMITGEEKEFIKKDLYALLDYLSEVATDGCYPETQCKVNLYISQFSIDTNYSYTHTNQIDICFVHAFDKFEIYTDDAEMTKKFKSWMQIKKSASVQISEVDKKTRIEFFAKQRQIIDRL